jgi:acylphosphatase
MITHLRIEGKVQGVYYRQTAIKRASEIGNISGWVRNRLDGSVEVLADGDEQSIQSLKDWCRTGSPASTVIAVEELSVDRLDSLPDIISGIFRKESTV